MNRVTIFLTFLFIASTVKPPRGIAQTQSWFIQSSGTTNMLSGISFADANNGVGVGFSSS